MGPGDGDGAGPGAAEPGAGAEAAVSLPPPSTEAVLGEELGELLGAAGPPRDMGAEPEVSRGRGWGSDQSLFF